MAESYDPIAAGKAAQKICISLMEQYKFLSYEEFKEKEIENIKNRIKFIPRFYKPELTKKTR